MVLTVRHFGNLGLHSGNCFLAELSFRRYVFLVRIHFGVQWKDDLVLYMRAIMHELSEAGLHMYLLIEVQSSNFSLILRRPDPGYIDNHRHS